MVELSFKEKICLKMLIKNNNLGFGSINEGNYFINNISFKVLLKNREFLKETIIKSVDVSNALEHDICLFIEENIEKKEKEERYYNELKYEAVSEYINENLDKIHHVKGVLNETDQRNVFDNVIKSKINRNEINEGVVDSLFDSYSIVKPPFTTGREWIVPLISSLGAGGKEELKLYAIEKLRLLLENEIRNSQTLTDEEKKIVLESTNRNLNRYIHGNLAEEYLAQICEDCFFRKMYKNNVSIARVGTPEMNELSIEQMNNINIKNVKQIIELAKKKYDKTEFTTKFNNIFYKMYMILGKQRSLELIEGKYGEVTFTKLELMFNDVKTNDYQILELNAEPMYDNCQKTLQNFLFASGVNDVNANIKRILSGEVSSEALPFSRMINEWKLYYQLLGGNVVLSDLVSQLDSLTIILPPDEIEIEPTLKLAGLHHKDAIVEVYKKMQQRSSSTIPKVKGIFDEYEYEVLDLVDPIQMNVGYYTDCCFTFGGESENSLKHACTNEDNRIFVIKKDGKVVAQSWMWRKGNTLCFDNIEVYGIDTKAGDKFWKVYEDVGKQMLNISMNYEPNNQKIQLVTIGKGNTDIGLKGESLVCDNIPLPKKGLYTDATEQVILTTSEDYEKPRDYNVEAIYKDERKKVIAIDPQQSKLESIQKLEAHIDKINYSIDSSNFVECDSKEDYTFVVYGFDWFIGITKNGDIVKQEYSFDERSKEEISNTLKLISEKIKSGELNNNINDIMLNEMLRESATYGK